MDASRITLITAAFLIGGISKGAVGIGQMTVTLAILSNVMGLRELIPLMVIPALVTNVLQAQQGGDVAGVIRRFWILNATGFVGIWLGTITLFLVNPVIPMAVLGVVLCTFAAMNLTRTPVRVPAHYESVTSPLLGLISGLLTGATGTLHLLLIAYYQALGLGKNQFIQATAFTGVVSTLIWIGALVQQKALDSTVLLLSMLVVVPALVGMTIGTRVRDRVSQAVFRTCIFSGLLFIGLNLIRKSLL
ncbi:MAG: sulfite exporter TauE/SafE family protein [Gammaproteobacteria bacterium]